MRKFLGIYANDSYLVPISLVFFGFILLITQDSPIDSFSHLSGFVLGAGIMGLLYRNSYTLTAIDRSAGKTDDAQ